MSAMKWATIMPEKDGRMVVIEVGEDCPPPWLWRTVHYLLFRWIWVSYYLYSDLAHAIESFNERASR
jgi:hypothetical protein